ncbi:butyryl-CoA dehydrogenase [Duganella sp. CF458]|uniref:acyl-CoA dehydrogenase n=1 Tax=Duganella sp. CF458 TaxID=1884368 RepID=UPI0008EE0B6E|nr:acyl-CoA dehydrogenase [Duganella sp. CF458]SFG12316.1 butyryl-CoA dehydrogenase [Duganella sp. CF458]
MASRLLNRRDVEFMLYDWLDAERLAGRPRFADHSRETFTAALDTAEQIASELFAPHNKLSDQQEPHFDGARVSVIPEVKRALDAFSAAGLMAAGHDYALGGMQLPLTVEKAVTAYFTAANMATSSYAFLTIGNANTLLKCASTAQVEHFVRPMLEGRWFGTMCLSEPQAGSSLSDISTRAAPDPDVPGQYRVCGNKMWISGGEHELAENIVHLVLAKIPGADGKLVAGVKGISLFIVPKFLDNGERNDIALAGLNHKMGNRGTTNCLLNFGEGRHLPGGRSGAVGYLVGRAGQGLLNMFHMMNEARIGVGLAAAVLGYTGYLHALEYARERPQGRHPAAKDPSSPQLPIIAHTDVRRMLLAQKAYVEGALGLCLYSARLVDDEHTGETPEVRQRAGRLLEFLTPITKSWPSQWGLEANNLAIQVHGGYGYTREYNVEQFYRDNRLNQIHEGTHGIHGLDLLGRKASIHDGALLKTMAEEIRATVQAARNTGRGADARQLDAHASALDAAWCRVEQVTQALYAASDLNQTLANATVYLEAVGHVVVAWIWLQQAMAAVAKLPEEDSFRRGKLQACRYFYQWELPKVQPQLDLLAALDTTTLDMQDAWF